MQHLVWQHGTDTITLQVDPRVTLLSLANVLVIGAGGCVVGAMYS